MNMKRKMEKKICDTNKKIELKSKDQKKKVNNKMI